MTKYFPEINKIEFEGPDSKNPLAFKHYNPKECLKDISLHYLHKYIYFQNLLYILFLMLV